MKKGLVTIIFLCLLANLAYAIVYERREDIVFYKGASNSVFTLPNATVTVYQSDQVTLATIYSDNAGLQVIPGSQVTTDSSGRYYYYAPGGMYSEKIEKTGYSTRWRYDLFIDTDAWNPSISSLNVAGTATITTANLTTVNKTGTGVVTNWNADLLDGYTTGNATGQICPSNGTTCTNLIAEKAYTLLADGSYRTASNAPTANQIPVLNATSNLALPSYTIVPNNSGYTIKNVAGTALYAISRDTSDRLIIGDGVDANVYTSSLSKLWHAGNTGVASSPAMLNSSALLAQNAPSGFTIGGNTAWHAGNMGTTGSTSGTTIAISIGSISVTSGDIILVTATGNTTASGSGNIVFQLSHTGVTGNWDGSSSQVYASHYTASASAVNDSMTGIFTSTQTGTLTLNYSSDNGSAYSKYMQYYFLKKQ